MWLVMLSCVLRLVREDSEGVFLLWKLLLRKEVSVTSSQGWTLGQTRPGFQVCNELIVLTQESLHGYPEFKKAVSGYMVQWKGETEKVLSLSSFSPSPFFP